MAKKNLRLAVCCVLGAATATCAAVGLAACATEDTWDVSADGCSVSAVLEEKDGGLLLKISGSGKMRDFEKGGAPWSDRSGEITAVTVANGVESIGANAFGGITGADYVILPSSIKSAGEDFEGGVKIFAMSGDIDFAGGAPEELYIYTEEAIQTNDRFWQSDKSSGDIIADGEDLSSDQDGKYWKYVSADSDEAMVYEKLKVLFIGNSFTYRNGIAEFSSGVPGLFDGVAEDLGFAVETYSITGPGGYLENHAKATDTCGRQVDKLLNACDDFDYIVLQDQSTCSYRENSRFINGVNLMQSKINSTQTHAKVYLYSTWGSPYSSGEDGTTIAEMEMKIRNAYDAAAEQFGLEVTHVGAAFTDAYYNDKIYLWDTDNRHQGFAGAYLSACTHVASMLGADVRQTAFTGEGTFRSPDGRSEYTVPALDGETLSALREAAYKAGNGELVTVEDGQQPPSDEDDGQEGVLRIAGWGRFIEEDRFDLLVKDFKAWCDETGVEYTEIAGTYYEGATQSSPCYFIADYTAQILKDGGADVVLPCATNFNANQAAMAAREFVPIDVYGQKDRQVGVITDLGICDSFTEYIVTDRAATILETADAGQGGQGDAEREGVLRIACWGRFMDEGMFNALVAGFESWLKENGTEYNDIIGTYYADDNYYLINDLVKKISEDGGTDVVLPCATNFNDNQTDKLVVAEKFQPIEVAGQTNRQVGVMDEEDELTQKFLEYVQTDGAKAIMLGQA